MTVVTFPTYVGGDDRHMSSDDLPFFQAAQLKNLLNDVRALAAQKRLEAVFEVELFGFAQEVAAVLAAPTRDTGEAALREGRALLQKLKDAPDKSDSQLLMR